MTKACMTFTTHATMLCTMISTPFGQAEADIKYMQYNIVCMILRTWYTLLALLLRYIHIYGGSLTLAHCAHEIMCLFYDCLKKNTLVARLRLYN